MSSTTDLPKPTKILIDAMLDELEVTRYLVRQLAPQVLGEPFGKDAGLCWCYPFYRGEKWPGHDEFCTFVRNNVPHDPLDRSEVAICSCKAKGVMQSFCMNGSKMICMICHREIP
jgi:hypothetical protein